MGEQKKAKISDLIPDNKNYNKGNTLGNKLIEKSLRNLGAGRSILLDKNNRIIAGNKTIENATSIGLDDIIIVETTGNQIVAVKRTDIDLDSKKGREMALADNATAKQNIEWDEKALCDDWSIDEQKEWGITDFVVEPEVQEDDYQIPKEIKTDIKLGDIFDIGEHRLICGDSTKPDTYKVLFGEEKADLVVTDPPYGVGYTGKTKESLKIENDSLTEEQTHNLWKEALDAFWPFLKKGGSIYASVPEGRLHVGFAKALKDLDALRQILVWNKGSMVMGRSDYHYKHEPILYGWKPGGTHYFTKDRTKTSVLDFPKPNRNADHPTMKPVPLWAELINNSSKKRNIVFDCFIGSGTTMVACEQLKRRCFGVELDPRYCQVILQRVSSLTPGIALKKNGEPYKLK